MQIKKMIKILFVLGLIFVAVQFSLAYVNHLQLKSIMESEALDARRSSVKDEDSLIRKIEDRARCSNVAIPDEVEYMVEGLEDKRDDLVITADYVEEVNLLVHVVRWPRTIQAVAEAPDRD